MRAVLSIGSNVGDRAAHLRSVVEDFSSEIVAVSPIFSTPAWGVEDQPDFYNATLLVDVDSTPLELLHRGQALEQAAHRVRDYKWGPRTLDVDIVALYDDSGPITCETPELTVPHPYAHERAFVLVPWLAIDPDAVLAGRSVTSLLAELDTSDISEVGTL